MLSDKTRNKISELALRLQVPIDKNADYENTTWCNRDLIPIPPDRQTYGVGSYFGYWIVGGCCISAWTLGSSLIAYGLSVREALGMIVVGSIIIGCLSVLLGWCGAKHHIGYTVSCRYAYGMRGSYIPVIFRIFVACIWFGVQAFWGGQACRVMLGAIIPGLAHMDSYINESEGLMTNDFIGFILYFLAYIPLVLVPPEKLQRPFFITSAMFVTTCFGLLIWGVTNVGSAGPLFASISNAPRGGWSVIFGLNAAIGAYSAGTLGQSDWTRYANRKVAPTLSQLVAVPFAVTFTATVGAIVTSCAQVMYGEIIWNPIDLLAQIQLANNDSPRVRAAVFFAGLGLFASQVAINVVLNSVSIGMDMSGLFPKYINIRRGSYILAAIGVCVQPWRYVETATKFLTVLSGMGIFMNPMCGILCADYLVVRQRKLRLDHLYIGDSRSIYWYQNGFNWRGPIALALSAVPLIPGLAAAAANGETTMAEGWIDLYNINFFYGFTCGFLTTVVFGKLLPPPGLGEDRAFDGTERLRNNGDKHVDLEETRFSADEEKTKS